jgi:hypothetical protein
VSGPVASPVELASARPVLELAMVLTGSTRGAADLVATALTADSRIELTDGQDALQGLRARVVRAFLASLSSRSKPQSAASGLNALAGPVRTAVALRDVDRLTVAEIAATMDRPPPKIVALLMTVPPGGHDVEFAELTAAAPTPADVAARLVPARRALSRSRRWRTALPTAIAVIVVALVAVPTIVRPHWPVTVRLAGTWRYSHEVRLRPGWQIAERTIEENVETTRLLVPSATGTLVECTVVVAVAGLPPNRDGQINATRVGGRPAEIVTGADNEIALDWEYASNAWASVACDPVAASDDDLRLSIATAVRFGERRQLLPFTLTRLPAGYQISSVGEGFVQAAGFARGPVVWLTPVDVAGGAVPMFIGADPAPVDSSFVTECLDRARMVCLNAHQPGEESAIRVPLRSVAATRGLIRLAADPSNRSTWMDAMSLPAH